MNRLIKHTLLFVISYMISTAAIGQLTDIPKGWHLLDEETSGYYGISLEKAYSFIKSKKIKSKSVIVAVIDSGIDTLHEDIKSVLWKNPKEIPSNGVDEDKNGYVDDIYGWNFLGGRDGKNVEGDSYEAARVYHNLRSKYEGKNIDSKTLSPEEALQYEMWKRSETVIVGNASKTSSEDIIVFRRVYKACIKNDSIIRKAIGREKYTGKELGEFNPIDNEVKKAKNSLFSLMTENDALETYNQEFIEGFGDFINAEEKKIEAAIKAPEDYRGKIVKDRYNDLNDRFYGNPDIMVNSKSALHGTHVSGIIAASRGNGKGIDGVADNVKIMTLRIVPDGDEHDKDIALAIRYAVDNGAQVINMSFGKGFSPEKKWVDDAVRYAERKGVLLVHAAGNDAEYLATAFNYPNPVFLDGKTCKNWITVGASGDSKGRGLVANFSNYGKQEVDVFAPGVKIYSTVPGGNTYQYLQGTSMASPVVAGLAAFILEYYPSLTAEQIKNIIEKSAKNPGVDVSKPGTDEMVDFSELSRSGGIINAYEAIKLASETIEQPLITKTNTPSKEERSPEKTNGFTIEKGVKEGKYYGLIIGVSDYDNQKLDLDNPTKDAKKLKEILIKSYTFQDSTISLILNPTRQKVLAELFRLRKIIGPTDNLLIFYAGHGYWDEEVRQGYWWLKDASTNDPANWLSNSDLREQIRGLKSLHTLLISDACFSGGIFKTRGVNDLTNATKDVQVLYKMPSRRAITSGTMTTVPDRSVFLEYLLKRLSENKNKFLSAQQLFDSFRVAVINNSSAVPQDGVIAETGDEGGDFIFIRKGID